jgi:hypothetical protein
MRTGRTATSSAWRPATPGAPAARGIAACQPRSGPTLGPRPVRAEVCTEGRRLCRGPRFSVPARALSLYRGPRRASRSLAATVTRVSNARRGWSSVPAISSPRPCGTRPTRPSRIWTVGPQLEIRSRRWGAGAAAASAALLGVTRGAVCAEGRVSLYPSRAVCSLYRGPRDSLLGDSLVHDGGRSTDRGDSTVAHLSRWPRLDARPAARGFGQPARRTPPRLVRGLAAGSVPSPAQLCTSARGRLRVRATVTR